MAGNPRCCVHPELSRGCAACCVEGCTEHAITQSTLAEYVHFDDEPASGAKISDCGHYRYRLWRTEPGGRGTIVFIMLNPSTADAREDDPTIRRCRGFTRSLGYRRLEILNLFAYRATDPSDLSVPDDPIGELNDMHILHVCEAADIIIAAWGIHGQRRNRSREVVGLLWDFKLARKLHCLAKTKAGHPRHPLYLRRDLKPIQFEVEVYGVS